MFRPRWVCPVQGYLWFPSLHCSGSRLFYMERALRCARFQFSGTLQKLDSVAPVFFASPGLSGSGSQIFGSPLPGCSAPFPSTAPARATESGLRKSLDRNQGLVCSVVGGAFSGVEFAPFPSPLPPTSSWDGPALLWGFSVPLFWRQCVQASSVFRPAVRSGQLIFPCYPTV